MAERNPGAGREDGRDPVDEDAVWAAIVAGYGEEPADPDLSSEDEREDEDDEDEDAAEDRERQKHPGPTGRDDEPDDDGPEGPGAPGSAGVPDRPLGSSVTAFASGVGPRDWTSPDASEDDDEGDEGHFVPPEPPPLPEADTTAKFAWLAVLGGPLLLLLAVLLRWDMTWWLTALGVGGFLGGFATLVVRMRDGDDGDDDPGRGAVV
ncbi:hypothetical protein [Streptomyces sp. 8N706]|uniref:hypothetical protein n=1 Tax=Streptomyces sp. 8N706 TaxID=3457416 RepID=UPI003FD0116D